MAKTELPSPEVVRQLIRYEPDTGHFYFFPRPPAFFSGDRDPVHTANNWNARWAGKRAFTASHHGYRHGHLLWAKVRACRVAWAVMMGEWPNGFIDHINGDRADDRWDNLRTVTRAENAKNCATPRRNTSGHIGVTWDATAGKWRAQIRANGKNTYLGVYLDKADAIRARREAQERFGFHINHGR